MLTGRLPHRHGVHTYQRSFSPLARADTVIGDLDGYESIGVTTNFYAGSAFGFDELFDEFVDVSPDLRYPDSWRDFDGNGLSLYLNVLSWIVRSGEPWEYFSNGLSSFLRSRIDHFPVPSPYDDGAVPTNRVATRRVERAEGPFFLFVNYMDVHQPLSPHVGLDRSLHSAPNSWTSKDDFYRIKWDLNARGKRDSHDEFLSHYRALYGASVDYLDRRVCQLIDDIDRSTAGETTFVITADHGENLGFAGDDYFFEHTASLTEALLHVPLCVINAPGDVDETVEGYVSHLRLRELLVGLAAGEVPDVTDERIPAEVVGLSPGSSSLNDAERTELERMIRAAYEGEEKYQWDSDGRAARYRLDRASPSTQELVDDAATVPPWATELFEEEIDAYRTAATEREQSAEDDLDAEARTRLEDLGYL